MSQANSPRSRYFGRSFKGQNLAGADFQGADVRGADFTEACLIGADFEGAQTGLSRQQALGVGLLVLGLTLLAGFITGYAASIISSFKVAKDVIGPYALAAGWLGLLILAGFLWFALRRGLAVAGVAAVTLAALAATIAAFGSAAVATVAVVQSLAIAGAVAGVLYGAVALATAVALGGPRLLVTMVVLAVGATALGIAFGVPELDESAVILAIAIAALISLGLLALSLQAGWQAWHGNPKYALLRHIAITLTAQGTSFRGADLTEANLAKAHLGYADLRRARLMRTHWADVRQLKRARVEGTYLAHPQIQQLVVTKDGHNQCFDRQDLRGLNLTQANLADASFLGADLGDSTLAEADLSRANLVQAQLQRTDLTQACLTGAYIEDWGLSTSTQLTQVRCDYIFMHYPTKEDPDPCRKPDNRQEVFQPEDFADFIAPIIKTLDLYRQQHVDPRLVAHQYKTLDLYHHGGIDPAAAAIALKSLADQYPNSDLQVIALEGRGREKIRLQARVAGNLDRSELSEEYFERYRKLQAMPYSDIQALLAGMAEKDDRIRSLETMVATAIENNRFYVETYYNIGDTVTEKNAPNINSGGGSINYVGGDIRDASGVVNLGQLQGDVSQAIQQLSDSDRGEQPDLKELLVQLQGAIAHATALPPEDKAEALEQVKTLAEAAHAPANSPLKNAAKTAMKVLKGTAAGLPDTTKFVEEINRLLPAIATLVGLL